jgi:hypothetical protein
MSAPWWTQEITVDAFERFVAKHGLRKSTEVEHHLVVDYGHPKWWDCAFGTPSFSTRGEGRAAEVEGSDRPGMVRLYWNAYLANIEEVVNG